METITGDFQSTLEDFSRALEHADLSFRIQALSRLASRTSNDQQQRLSSEIDDLKQELAALSKHAG